MVIKRFYIALGLFYTLCYLTSSLTTSPYISPNPIYSAAGTYIFDTSPYYNTPNSTLNPLTFNIAFTRAHLSNNYSFGYSIKRITYTITGNKVNYTLQKVSKSSSFVSLKFYTTNANQISNLAISYIIIQPLFNIYDFQFSWIKPNSNIFNGQNFQATLSGVGPYSINQTIWTTIVGVDASLSSNNEIDLYAMAWLATTTDIQFKISTISPTSFYLSSVIIEVFIFNSTLLVADSRTARFTFGERDKTTGLSYTNTSMKSYNTIYGFRTYHTVNENYLNFQWTLANDTLSVTTTNAFSWVAFNYLFLEFITCGASTPYLMLSNSTCYDVCPIRYYADGYSECQVCPYDCYYCFSNNSCSQCSNSSDYRYLNTSTYRCSPLDGYYDDGVNSQAIPCNSSNCITCTSDIICLTCYTKTYLAANNTCQNCMPNCENCTSSSNCFNCSTNYTYQNGSCVVDCSSIMNCSQCILTNQTVVCTLCVSGYNVTNNTCLQLCGNSIKTVSQECDDGNINNGDGCSSTCLIEISYYCNVSIDPTVCSNCTANCINCTSSACIACSTNYMVINGTCSLPTSNVTNSTNNTNATNTTNTTNTTNSTNSTNSTNTTNTTDSTNSTNSTTSSTIPTNTTNTTGTNITSISTICGNGIIQINQGCDDGNLINNDGCNSQCQVQQYFSCLAQPFISVCNLNTLISSILSITKNPSSNDLYVSVQFQPANLQVYKTVNWQSTIYQKSRLHVNMTSAYYDSTLGALIVSYSYFQNVNGNKLVIGYDFTNSAPFSSLNNATTTATLDRQRNNLSLDYYSPQTYKLSSIVYNISVGLSAIALIVFIIGFVKGKIIALQLITIFQITYLSLLSVDKLSPVFYSLNGLYLSCGYAINLTGSKPSINKFAPVNLNTIFVDNYNLNFIFIILPLVISIVLILIGKAKQLDHRSNITILGIKMRNQWIFYGLMFSIYIFSICLGLSLINFSTSPIQLIGLVINLLLIIATILLSLKLLFGRQQMGQFQSSFAKQKWLSKNLYLVLLLQRMITSTILSISAISIQTLIVINALQIGLVTFLRPYTIMGNNLRPLLNLGITLLIESIFFTTSYMSSRSFQMYAPCGILALLLLSLIYNIYYFVKFMIENKDAQLQAMTKEIQAKEFKLLNSQRVKIDLQATFFNQTILHPQQENNLQLSSALWSIKQRLNKIKQVNVQGDPRQNLQEQIILMQKDDDFIAL